jgi:predicted DNA-binding transcriptional regulator AlpA
MQSRKQEVLPRSLPPRGLSREQSAQYVGVLPSLFDMLVKDGRMPAPKRINSRNVWDRLQLDAAFRQELTVRQALLRRDEQAAGLEQAVERALPRAQNLGREFVRDAPSRQCFGRHGSYPVRTVASV